MQRRISFFAARSTRDKEPSVFVPAGDSLSESRRRQGQSLNRMVNPPVCAFETASRILPIRARREGASSAFDSFKS